MSEVQIHGNSFENMVIFNRTQLKKEEYDKLKTNGYTSAFDLVEDLLVEYNASIKTTGSNVICCSDILRMMNHTEDYRLIVGCYDQIEKNKVFHTQYEFFITSNDYSKLWGSMTYESVEPFVVFVKSILEGKEAQKNTLNKRNEFQKLIQCKNSLMKINPKVDSKKQRRVQCSVKLDQMLSSGIKYKKTNINFTVESCRRTFNK